MTGSGQKRKSSESVNVIRFTPESGQIADIAGCPLCADFVVKVVDAFRKR
jgi:hypothetical protein